ncbi:MULTISPECIES: PRD domain-containing protein [Tissierellales]|nr:MULTISPECIES: PRD domain-containing protein [Tissierellales]SCL85589.1 Transcription antiterminator LicT [Sporanaerobacter sp. PP17-6a]
MKIVRNINNNVSLCKDSKNREVVIFGKGVGFLKANEEVPLSKIERTFYNVNKNYLDVIASLPENVLEVSSKIIDMANIKLNTSYKSNVVLSLADHINYAIQRRQNNISIKLPLIYEIRHLYPKETEIGIDAVKLISNELNVNLLSEEAVSITLHLVNYGITNNPIDEKNEEKIIANCTKLIEDELNIKIDRSSFNYFRFVSHLHYLFSRTNEQMKSDNEQIYKMLKNKFTDTDIYDCTIRIRDYLCKMLDFRLNDEELLYLMIHINRLCVREDCYRQGLTST